LKGYAGQILRVNLTTGQSRTEPLSEDMARNFLGGRGFVAKILFDELDPSVEPFSEENIVVMAPGPLSGLFLPSSGKIHFGTKGPATGGYADSNMGGHMASELRYAGYDALIIEGKADKPCVVMIDDDRIQILNAEKYWGMKSFEAEKAIKDDYNDEFQVATIGPAGENLVKYACISHDFGRQAGRTGIGAVLGSKNVKAIAVRGSQDIPLQDVKGALKKGRQMFMSAFKKPGFKEWTPYGTAGVTDWVNEVGSFPTKNFYTGYFDDYKKINGQTMREAITITDKACFNCPIPCGKYAKASYKGEDIYVEGPEYETIALIGGNCMIDDINEVAYLNLVVDQLGIDSISGGNVVAFALECYEKGIITKEDVGREIKFGDTDSAAYLFELIAKREGIGDLLAEGVKIAAEKLGQDSAKFAIHVKGLEVSGYEPRYNPAMLLSFMTADVGAHHNRSWAITYDVASGRDNLEGKADKVIELQHIRPLFDALGLCRLPWVEIGFELELYGELFPLVTGIDYDWDDLIGISERIWHLTRSFNVKHIPGFGRDWDYPPARFYEEKMPSGPIEGKGVSWDDVEWLLDDYYKKRGWTEAGIPKKATLKKHGLDFVVHELALTE